MNAPLSQLDWSLVPALLAVADTGSLSAAAARLGRSQPTLGRQIAQAEATLGLTLFTRHPRGLTLTEAGAALLPAARAMDAAAHDLTLAAAGRDHALSGTVRISASQLVAHHILPPILARLRREHPGISIDLAPSDNPDNLLLREADIAVRMFPSTQLDLVTRRLGGLPVTICAARSYLDRRGRPATPEELLSHDLVGYDRSDLILRRMREFGWPATRDWFVMRCDDQPANLELVRAGCGIGFAQSWLVEADPELEAIDVGLALPALPVWLAAPQATRHSPRIATVWRALDRGLASFVS